MSFLITNNSITTSSEKITLEEAEHQIELRNEKIIITDKFISVDTFVFPKKTPIPFYYIPMEQGYAQYDVSTGTTVKNITSNPINADYTQLLVKVLGDSSIEKTFTVSACQSKVSGDALNTEMTYFYENKSFNSSAYNASNPAPVVLFNNEVVPYTSNSDVTITQSGNTLTFTSNISNSIVYISLMVTLL